MTDILLLVNAAYFNHFAQPVMSAVKLDICRSTMNSSLQTAGSCQNRRYHLLGVVLQAALPGLRLFAWESYGFWICPVTALAAGSCLASMLCSDSCTAIGVLHAKGLSSDESLGCLDDLHAYHDQSDTTRQPDNLLLKIPIRPSCEFAC